MKTLIKQFVFVPSQKMNTLGFRLKDILAPDFPRKFHLVATTTKRYKLAITLSPTTTLTISGAISLMPYTV